MKARLVTEPRKPARRQRRRKTEKRSTDLLAALCFTMALTLLLTSTGSTLAKYIREDRSAVAAVAAPFYFTSPQLTNDQEPPYYLVSEPDGDRVSLTVDLANYIDDLRRTPDAISCRCWVENTAGEEVASAEDLTLSGNKATLSVPLSVPKSAFGSGEDRRVTVFAQATAPYGKTLKAQYGFDRQTYPLRFTVTEEGGAAVLRVSGGSAGTVTVDYSRNQALSADLSGGFLTKTGAYTVQYTAAAGKEYAITFFKTGNSVAVSAADFDVTQ